MRLTVKLAVLLLFASTLASANTLVVPYGMANITGNATVGLTGPENFQYQEDFGRGPFYPVGESLLITQIAFRSAPGSGPVNTTVRSFSIFLSTSPYYPNAMGTHTLITSNYAANEGADNTLVLSGGPGKFFSSPGCAGPGPCPFDMVFNLTTPFVYNPEHGTLLLDAQFKGWSGSSGNLDAESFSWPGGVVAQVNSNGQMDLGGPIVQFGFTPVPEPGSVSLLVAGLAAFAGVVRRKKMD